MAVSGWHGIANTVSYVQEAEPYWPSPIPDQERVDILIVSVHDESKKKISSKGNWGIVTR